jgi:hypothetical protein
MGHEYDIKPTITLYTSKGTYFVAIFIGNT